MHALYKHGTNKKKPLNKMPSPWKFRGIHVYPPAYDSKNGEVLTTPNCSEALAFHNLRFVSSLPEIRYVPSQLNFTQNTLDGQE